MTVEINTITRDKRHRDLGWYCAKGVPIPRSIVTDHYLLDHHTGGKPGQWDDGPANDDQVRGTYLAYGISLDLSCDLKG